MHEFTFKAGLDLLGALRNIFQKWQSEGRLAKVQEMRLMLVIAFPKTRNQGGHIEAVDIWGFLLIDTIKKIGIEISGFNCLSIYALFLNSSFSIITTFSSFIASAVIFVIVFFSS